MVSKDLGDFIVSDNNNGIAYLKVAINAACTHCLRIGLATLLRFEGTEQDGQGTPGYGCRSQASL